MNILFDQPLFFWFGILALIVMVLQIFTGAMMTVGKRYEFLKYHKLVAVVLVSAVLAHILFIFQ